MKFIEYTNHYNHANQDLSNDNIWLQQLFNQSINKLVDSGLYETGFESERIKRANIFIEDV